MDNNNNKDGNSGSSWMNHPNLSGMDPAKLAMLQSLAEQGSQKGQSDIMPFLMAAASKSQSSGMQFSKNEMDTIIEVLKIGKPPAEVAKMDRMLQLMKMMR
jgi:hypothetical protein